MSGFMQIGGKVLNIQEAAEKLNSMGLDASDFSEAMHVFNLEFPFEVAIVSGDGCEGSIRSSYKEITEAEAI